jgi:hypothetical protein
MSRPLGSTWRGGVEGRPRRTVVFILVCTTIGFVLGGAGGGLIAGLAAAISISDARLVALYAFVGVVFAGLLSVAEQPLDVNQPIASFVGEHPGAANVGRLALILLLVATAALWRRERTLWRIRGKPLARKEVGVRERLRYPAGAIAVFAMASGTMLIFAGDSTLRWASVPLFAVALVSAAGWL